MSHLLKDWLNNEIALSLPIISLEDDFSNGYLFGELLSQFNQVEITNFSSKPTAEAKIKNFCMLEPAMKRLGVNFSSKLASDIMIKREGAAKNLLYETKIALEKVARNSRVNQRNLAMSNSEKILTVIAPKKEKYEKTMSITFENGIRLNIENANQKYLEAAISHHTSKIIDFRDTIDHDYELAMSSIKHEVQTQRKMKFGQNENTADFLEAWNGINSDIWKKNQQIAKERRELRHKVNEFVSSKKNNLKKMRLNESKSYAVLEMNGFDNKIGNVTNGINLANSIPDDYPKIIKTIKHQLRTGEQIDIQVLNKEKLAENFEINKQVLETQQEEKDSRNNQHFSRRRKYVYQHSSKLEDESVLAFRENLFADVILPCDAERNESVNKVDVSSYSEIMKENRLNREEIKNQLIRYEVDRQSDWGRAEAYNEVHVEIISKLNSQNNRSRVVIEAITAANRRQSVEVVNEIMNKVLDLTDWVISCRIMGIYNHNFNFDHNNKSYNLNKTSHGDSHNNGTDSKGGKSPQIKAMGKQLQRQLSRQLSLSQDSLSNPDYVKLYKQQRFRVMRAASTVIRTTGIGILMAETIPKQIWRDAAHMFTLSSDISLPFPEPSAIDVTQTLYRYSISDRPMSMNPKWLLSKLFSASSVLLVGSNFDNNNNGHFQTNGLMISKTSAGHHSVAARTASELVREIEPIPTFHDYNNITSSGNSLVSELDSLSLDLADPNAVLNNPIPNETLIAIEGISAATVLSNANNHYISLMDNISLEETNEFIQEINRLIDNNPIINEQYNISRVMKGDDFHDIIPTKDVIYTPPWVFNTSPKYLLGEIIVNMRCQLDPFPPLPESPMSTSHLLLRCALCGISDFSRKSLAEAIRRTIPGIFILRVEDLVNEACTRVMTRQMSNEISGNNNQLGDKDLTNNDDGISVCSQGSNDSALKFNPVDMDLFIRQSYQHDEEHDILCDAVADSLKRGEVIADEYYVKLLVNAIKHIPVKDNHGYVIQDFPNTTSQAVKLMEAFSNINYSKNKPQKSDKSSKLTTYYPKPKQEEMLYDPSLCGLDSVIYISSGVGIGESLNERMRARLDTVSNDMTLFKRLQILDELKVSTHGNLYHAVHNKAIEIKEKYFPFYDNNNNNNNNNSNNNNTIIEIIDYNDSNYDKMNNVYNKPQGEHDAASLVTEDFTLIHNAIKATQEEESFNELIIQQQKQKEFLENLVNRSHHIPHALCQSLLLLWEETEQQSLLSYQNYFIRQRDVNYQIIQRRRIVYDSMNYLLLRLDQRQELFDEFRKSFNAIDNSMRFDLDTIAELHLQALELGEAIFRMCYNRNQEAEEYLDSLKNDQQINLFIHSLKCENSILIQSELNRFYIILHLLFDSMKAIQGYDYCDAKKYCNPLEVTLGGSSSGGTSGSGGNTKGASNSKNNKTPAKESTKSKKPSIESDVILVPYREVVSKSYINNNDNQSLMLDLSKDNIDVLGLFKAKNEDENNNTSKNSKAGKGGNKKTSEKVPVNVFEMIRGEVLNDLNQWSRDSFVLNRDIYGRDEELCVAIETAIWYEAEKIRISIDKISKLMDEQIAWVTDSEKSMMNILSNMIKKRYTKELTAGNKLIGLIQESIENAESKPELLLVSPDATPITPGDVMKLTQVLKQKRKGSASNYRRGSFGNDDSETGLVKKKKVDKNPLEGFGLLSNHANTVENLEALDLKINDKLLQSTSRSRRGSQANNDDDDNISLKSANSTGTGKGRRGTRTRARGSLSSKEDLRRKSFEKNDNGINQTMSGSRSRHNSGSGNTLHSLMTGNGSHYDHQDHNSSNKAAEYEKYKKQLEEYNRKKHALEHKFAMLYNDKEEELKTKLGLSSHEAKLKAHHIYFLQHQKEMNEFEHQKPHQPP
eukprot:gene14000-18777_t